MAVFTVDEVCSATAGSVRGARQSEIFTGICTDTRKVEPGDLFICLVGETFDGHDFIEQALQRGAVGVVVSRLTVSGATAITVIVVADTLLALQDIARFHRNRFTIPVVAITGSNGKTTTKDMTAAVLSSKYNVLKTEANYNNEIGLPMTLLQLTKHHEVAVVEMGMRGRGQIEQLAKIALPTIAVITNVGETHIELLGSMEEIAEAKAELLTVIPPNGLTILNADDRYVLNMAQTVKNRIVTFGLEQGDLHAAAIEADGEGMHFACHFGKEQFSAYVPTVGKHNVYNALTAIAVALELGLDSDSICSGLRTFQASPMRLHIEEKNGYIIINDAYNASPMSMSAAIDTLVEVANARTVAILGDMLELGHVAVEAHRQIGEKLAQSNIDIIVTVGPLAVNIAQAANEAGAATAVICHSHIEASEVLKRILKQGDTILIKGSRGMKMEQMVNML